MKHFLLLLCVFLLLPIRLNAAPTEIPFIQSLQKVVEPLNNLLIWDMHDTSPLTGQQGYTPWQSFAGGRARYVSCSAGIPKDGVLLTGVQVLLEPEITLQKPSISTDFAAQQTKILHPLENPLPTGHSRTNHYRDDVIFPIIFKLNQTTDALDIPVDIVLPLTTPFEQLTHSLHFNLNLKPEKNGFTTPMCAALMSTLQKTAAPAYDHVKGVAYIPREKEIALSLNFNFEPTRVFVQLDNDLTLTPIQHRIAGKTAFLSFQTDKVVSLDEILNFKILTNKVWYDLPLSPQSGTPPMALEKDIFSFLGALCCFILSPFWLLLWRMPAQKRRVWSGILCAITLPLFIGLQALWIQQYPQIFVYPRVSQLLIPALLCGFFWVYQKPLFSWAVLLTLIVPYPFLCCDSLALVQSDIVMQLCCLFFMGLALIFPLILTAVCPVIMSCVFTRLSSILWPMSLFWLLPVCLIVKSVLIPLNERLPLYQQPAKTGLSLVIYDSSVSWANLGYNLFVWPFNPYKNWEKLNHLHLYRGQFDLNTPKTPQTFPVYRLIDATGREILTFEYRPSIDSLRQSIGYFINRQSVRAP